MWSFDTGHCVEVLLEHGVRVSYFIGNTDTVCDWHGTERRFGESEWIFRQEFDEAETESPITNLLAGSRPLLSYLSPTY